MMPLTLANVGEENTIKDVYKRQFVGFFVVADFLKTRSKLYDSDECREHYMIGISMWCEGPLYLFRCV